MTEMCGTIVIKAPYSVAMDAIVRRLRAKKNRITLLVPFKVFGLPVNLGVEREVEVAFVPLRGYKGEAQLHDELQFTWAPVGGGPYPAFAGTMHMHPQGSDTEIVLSGEYQPPFGVLGEAFDAVIGKRIAEATAQTLLEELREELEADFAVMKQTIEETPRHL